MKREDALPQDSKKPSHRSRPRKVATWPEQVRVGRAVVRIYRRQNASGNWSYVVANYSTGSRKFDSYSTHAAARTAAQELAARQLDGQQLAAGLRNADAAEYLTLRRMANGADLVALLSAASEALKDLEGDHGALISAARLYRDQRNRITKEVNVPDAVAEYIESKIRDQRRPDTIRDLKTRLNRFKADFQTPVSTVTTPLLSEWLDRTGGGPVVRRNTLVLLGTFFRWCGERGYIDPSRNPASGIKRPKIIRDTEPSTYSPEQLQTLLDHASPAFRPLVALMAFTGLRPAEALRLRWDQVRWNEGVILVEGRGAKTRTRRLVPILEPLASWIPNPKSEGPIWSLSSVSWHRERTSLIQASGVKWLQDGLRHSWISCRVGMVEDVGKVALEAGNSADVIFKNYRALKTKVQAEAWFAVRPR